MDRAEIRKLVNDKISRKISIQNPFGAPSRTTLGKNSLGEERHISKHLHTCSSYMNEYYKKVLGWIPANPSKTELKDAISSVYVFSKPSNLNNCVNTKEGHIKFKNEIMHNHEPNTTFLIGSKGSGKTFYLNYLVNTENQAFYKEKKIWYRAELSKLYRHNIYVENLKQEALKKDTKIYTLEEYFNVHITYVTFKYRKNNAILEEIWNDKDGIITDMLINKWYSLSTYQHLLNNPDKLIDEFKEFVEKACIAEKQHGDDLMKEQIRDLLWDKEKFMMSYLLADVILSYLKDNGFQPILIIDGIDNIDYYEYTHHYNDLINQVRTYCIQDDKKNKYNAKFIISVRDETYVHIRHLSQSYFQTVEPQLFRVRANNPAEILKRKVDVALQPTCDYFIGKRQHSASKIESHFRDSEQSQLKNDNFEQFIKAFDKAFDTFYSDFINQLIKAIQSLIPDDYHVKISYEQSLFKFFYNWNLRQFLSNFINIYKYDRLWQEKNPYIKEGRSYILTEGQLLNGSLYIDTKNQPFEFGKCIPNLFWFDESKPLTKWHGLCLLRILQYLRKARHVFEDDVFNNIHKLFAYDVEIIKKRFYFALSHGLIDCILSEDLRFKTFKLSDKGNFLIDYIFFDINLFYFVALDTPLSKDYLGRSSYVRIHLNNEEAYWDSYIESCVLTSITMMRHILTQHDNECSKLSDEEHHIYTLPDHFPGLLVRGIVTQMDRMKNFRDKSRLETLKDDIQGLI